MIATNHNDMLFARAVRYLAHAKGRENGITIGELAERLGISRRVCEQLIEENLQRFPFALVAGSAGYYRPTQSVDINQYLHNLHSRHRRMQIREATVRRKLRAEGWPETPTGQFEDPVNATQQELFA